jgi:hypothetical protein
MISSVSSNSAAQLASSSSSGQETQASLKKEIVAKEAEAESTKNLVEAAKLAAEIAALKAKLAALMAKKSEEPSENGAAARQAEFDTELLAQAKKRISI